MTQKELSYLEDAIMHEDSIIKICNDISTKVNESSFITFFNNQISTHQSIKKQLINLLKEKANE